MNKTKLVILETLQRLVRKMIKMLPAGAAVAILSIALFGNGVAHAALTRQLQVGMSGSDVTELQQFLSTDPLIYPARLTTGYYGALTREAVTQFQIAYGIPAVGRVGPMTMAKINALQSSGLGLDIRAPFLSASAVGTTSNNATISWTTNELARGQVYYSNSFIVTNETTAPFTQPFISGTAVSVDSNTRTSHNVTVNGLQPSTTYFYVVQATDASGNVSMTVPRTFRTNP